MAEAAASKLASEILSSSLKSMAGENQLEKQPEGGGGELQEENNQKHEVYLNESLLSGFALLRAVQLLNFDVYYLGLAPKYAEASRLFRLGQHNEAARMQASLGHCEEGEVSISGSKRKSSCQDESNFIEAAGELGKSRLPPYYRTILDDLSEMNPFQGYIDRWHLLSALCSFLKIALSLTAILISFVWTAWTVMLCLSARRSNLNSSSSNFNLTHQLDSIPSHRETESLANQPPASSTSRNSSMGQFVLVLYDLSASYILFCTIFNGHLMWNLLSQRLFLVSKRFQYKTMISLLSFIYLEYFICITFINNLYEWENTSTDVQSATYSIWANLRIFVTLQDKENVYRDVLLTIIQFARGIIRISPYITINYCIICLVEHVFTIRNQRLLTDSLKKRRKLRLVVRHRKQNELIGNEKVSPGTGQRKKKVIFATDESAATPNLTIAAAATSGRPEMEMFSTSEDKENHSFCFNTRSSGIANPKSAFNSIAEAHEYHRSIHEEHTIRGKPTEGIPIEQSLLSKCQQKYWARIGDFNELEAYITNLYIFTGRMNRFMSRQGMTAFFIVHNLVITATLIVPEAAQAGFILASLLTILTTLMGLLPFLFGQSLNRELWLLSKQIDRIIIQQQFTHRRRDNLVRIRELIQDIRVSCGGMLSFNVRTGIEYLIIASATGFFIEQEHYKLTRRH